MKANAVIRKLNSEIEGMTHVLFVKEENQIIRSFFVNDQIQNSKMTINEDLYNVKESFNEIEINAYVDVIAKRSNGERTLLMPLEELLTSPDLQHTYTVDHSGYKV